MLINKKKEIILYIAFGVITTYINIICYYICSHYIYMNTTFSNIIAWVLSVIFAYITNRKWVFESRIIEYSLLLREMVFFFSCRLITGVMDIFIMFVSVDILGWNGLWMKFLSNIIVIVGNYVFSKMIIFK